MLFIVKRCLPVLCLLVALATQTAGASLSSEETITLLADRLDQNQEKEGPHRGLWLPDVQFAGPMAGGMVAAYSAVGDPNYLAAAELAGDRILRFSDVHGNMLGDEVYAFVLLSEASEDPNDNVWRSALVEWYESMRRPTYEESTEEYIRYFESMERSTAIFYIAQHMIGAYYVDDLEKRDWRDALIQYLSHVDNESTFPVMALGVATWALATTGTLDDTPVTDYLSSPLWDGVVASDLPGILASHQVPEGEPFAGSFYWRFDHTAGDTGGVVAGYAEDCIYGVLGLTAVAMLEGNSDAAESDDEQVEIEGGVTVHAFDGAIQAGRDMLVEGVGEDGAVAEHLSGVGDSHHAYAGEMLQALWHVELYLESVQADDESLNVSVEPEPVDPSEGDQ